MKAETRMNRNFLLGSQGDAINPVLAGASLNFKKFILQVLLFVTFIKKLSRNLTFHKFKKDL